MSFFKKIFSGKEEQPKRSFSSVNDLKTGDIIVITDSFALPENLRNKTLQVTAVNSYEYENNTQTEWVLTGENNLEIFLSLEVDDKTYLKFSLKIEHDDVSSLFDLDQFSVIFDEEKAALQKQHDNEKTQSWSSDNYYQQIFAKVGFFHRKDHRSETLSSYEGSEAGEQFELYALYDDNEDRGVDVEVWSDGDTDVFLTLFRPTSDIIDMYPGS